MSFVHAVFSILRNFKLLQNTKYGCLQRPWVGVWGLFARVLAGRPDVGRVHTKTSFPTGSGRFIYDRQGGGCRAVALSSLGSCAQCRKEHGDGGAHRAAESPATECRCPCRHGVECYPDCKEAAVSGRERRRHECDRCGAGHRRDDIDHDSGEHMDRFDENKSR